MSHLCSLSYISRYYIILKVSMTIWLPLTNKSDCVLVTMYFQASQHFISLLPLKVSMTNCMTLANKSGDVSYPGMEVKSLYAIFQINSSCLNNFGNKYLSEDSGFLDSRVTMMSKILSWVYMCVENTFFVVFKHYFFFSLPCLTCCLDRYTLFSQR